MKKIVALILIVGLMSLSCKKDDSQKITIYTIEEGNHESDVFPKSVGKKISFKIKFDSTAIYTLDPIDQYDINKLFGFNACNSHHHTHSARFGWRWLNGNLEIHSYSYDNKQRTIAFLQTVKINEWNIYTLEDTGFSYIYTINNTSWIVSKTSCKTAVRYMLFPYFGGTSEAPHTIKIYFQQQ